MGSLLGRLGMTTDKGMNYQGVLFLSMAIILDMDPASPWRNYLMAATLICLAVVAFFTRGHIAETGPVTPDRPADEEDIDLAQSLEDVLHEGRQFAGMPLSLVSQKLPVGISQKGIDLIKEFEGFRAKAYLCPARVWTIGYGHTKGVKPGMVITKAQGEAMLRSDLKIYERYTSDALGNARTTQGQWDALVSFCYNAGPANLNKSSMLRLHKQGQFKAAADSFLNWTKGGGKVLPGLVRRRKAERALYLS